MSVGDESLSRFRRLALRLESAEHRRRLWGQPDVAHDRDPRLDDALRAREHRAGALELDDVGAALLDEANRGANRVLVGDLVRAERQVADHDRALGLLGDGSREEQHLVHGHWDGGAFVAEDDHRRCVSDEDHVDAGVLREARAGRVVGSDHDDLVAALLHGGELGQRQLARRWGAHSRPPSRGTLSMRRMPPTRTAAARTGGSNGATAT